MNKFAQRRDVLLILLAVVASAAGLFFLTRPKPPAQWNGKDAWQWASRLNYPDEKVRREATEALQKLGADATPTLLQRLTQREPISQRVRLWLGAQLPGKLGQAFTQNLKPTTYADLHSSAARALKLLGTNGVAAVPALLRAVRDPEPQVRVDSADALGTMGEAAVPGLIELLYDPGYQVRHYSAFALGQIGPPALAATPALLKCAGEENADVRSAALYALSRIGPRAGPAMLKAVTENRGEMRRVAAKALVAVHPRGQLTLPVLCEMAADPEGTSRATAIESLSLLHITHTNAMQIYFAALQDTNAQVRLAASKALAVVAHKSGPAAESLASLKQNDPDEAVRIAAGAALEKIAALAVPPAPSR